MWEDSEESQPNHHPAIQDFLTWIERAQVTEPHDDELKRVRSFIRDPSLKLYINGPRTVQKLLVALFPNQEPPVDPDEVAEQYSKVFCILLLAGKGRFITLFTQRQNLCDRYLPFESCPAHFPKASPNDSSFFELFYREQWKFCAPTFEFRIDKRFDVKDWVLPITHKVKLGGGVSASIFKITIDPAYNNLRTPLDQSGPDANTFILKTYKTKDAQRYYENELSAFRKLKNAGRNHRSIIGFHGSFVRDGTYNVLLEYANKGTLEEYFRTTTPPDSSKDIISFWRELFVIIEALQTIHSIQPNDIEGIHVFQGWHQDVKPDNILLTSVHPESPYECQFKLADLGNSHFRKTKGTNSEITDRDTYGTRAYGAPECYRSNNHIGKGLLQVTPAVDVWSLGCVLSEAAMWVLRSMKGLSEYRRRRKYETDQLHDFQDGDCFHDGERVLQIVLDVHEELSEFIRAGDHITQEVLSMAQDMLVASELRPSAKFLCGKAERIVAYAEKAERKVNPRHFLTGVMPSENGYHNDLRIRKLPPELPPGVSQSKYGSPSRRQTQRSVYDEPLDYSDMRHSYYNSTSDPSRRIQSHDIIDEIGLTSLGEHESQASPYSQESNHHRHRRSSDSGHSSDAAPRLHRKKSWDSYQSRNHDSFNARLVDNPRATTGEFSQRTNGIVKENCPLHLCSSQARLIRNKNRTSTLNIHPDSPKSREITSTVQSTRLDPSASSSPSAASPSNTSEEPHWQHSTAKTLSMATALRWKEMKKQGVRDAFLDCDYLLDKLNKRDHLFLIDDSSSMAIAHWSEVETLFGLLAYMIKSTKHNSIEVCFTVSHEKKKSKSTTDLMQIVHEKPKGGHSDVKKRLGSLLQDHQAKLQDFQTKLEHRKVSKSLWNKARPPPTAIRPFSIYVLTDGIWSDQCDPSSTIESMVKYLHNNNFPKQQVGIQFIRFGTDLDGKRRLEHLDSGLNLPIDIVDTEASDGDVWKMLLGGTESQWDNDHNDDVRSLKKGYQ